MLPTLSYRHPDLGQIRPLDSKAVEVARALESIGVDIPSSLLVFWNKGELKNDNPEPTFVRAIIKGSAYHLEPVQIETAQLLIFLDNIYAAGFMKSTRMVQEALLHCWFAAAGLNWKLPTGC